MTTIECDHDYYDDDQWIDSDVTLIEIADGLFIQDYMVGADCE